MKKAIYKIENKINHKIYIGQSNDPERRFNEHCFKREKYISLLDRAINKYGKDKFSFKILGWFEDYNKKEIYFIQHYRSLTPNGYNITKGGENPSIMKGEDNPASKITEEQAKGIKKDILNFSLPRKTIISKWKITQNIFRHINEGNCWREEILSYPLRPTEAQLNEKRVEKVIDLLKNTNLTHKEIGQIVGWNRSAITMINIGKNHHKDDMDYPIRK